VTKLRKMGVEIEDALEDVSVPSYVLDRQGSSAG